MKLLIEAFKIEKLTDIQRQQLDQGTDAEKMKIASEIVDSNSGAGGNIDVSSIKPVVVTALLKWGITDRNPFILFLNKADKVVPKLNLDTAQTTLEILGQANQNVDKLFYVDCGLFDGGAADVQYKLKVAKIFTNKSELSSYKDEKGNQLDLSVIMDGDKLKPTSEIRSILDTYFDDLSKDAEEKESVPLASLIKKVGKDYKKDPNSVLDYLTAFFTKSDYDKAIKDLEIAKKFKINKTLIINKLNSIFADDSTGAKVDKFMTTTKINAPYSATEIIDALCSALDNSKGGTLISGSQLIADQLKRPLKDLSFKNLMQYVFNMIKQSNVPYLKSQEKEIRQKLNKGDYDKEFREVFNSRYKVDPENGNAKSLRDLHEAIARLLQSLFAADPG